MNSDLIRINSMVTPGLAGPKAAMINFAYSFYLKESGLDLYRFIFVNEVGEDLEEFVRKQDDKSVTINIRGNFTDDYLSLDFYSRNYRRVLLIHEGLMRLAQVDKRFEKDKIEEIKRRILACKFEFEFVVKKYKANKNGLIAQLNVSPEEEKFRYKLEFISGSSVKCKLELYTGDPSLFYVEDFFGFGKWLDMNEFVVSGKKREVEFHTFPSDCLFSCKNLTDYPKPLYFEAMRGDLDKVEKLKAIEDWKLSLKPSNEAVIRSAIGGALN